MPLIQRTALIGFAIDLFVVLFLFWGINTMDFSNLAPEWREIVSQMAESSFFYLFHIGVLVAQALALVLISQRHKAGLILAVVSGCMLLPMSVVYIIGAVVSAYSARFGMLASPPVDGERPYRTFKPALNRTYAGLAALGLILIVLFLPMGLVYSAMLSSLFCFALAFGYLAYRSSANVPLQLFADYFVIHPHVLAMPVAIPYEDVEAATLLVDDSIRLDVRTGGRVMFLRWVLNSVIPEERPRALEDFGRALLDHGVDLR